MPPAPNRRSARPPARRARSLEASTQLADTSPSGRGTAPRFPNFLVANPLPGCSSLSFAHLPAGALGGCFRVQGCPVHPTAGLSAGEVGKEDRLAQCPLTCLLAYMHACMQDLFPCKTSLRRTRTPKASPSSSGFPGPFKGSLWGPSQAPQSPGSACPHFHLAAGHSSGFLLLPPTAPGPPQPRSLVSHGWTRLQKCRRQSMAKVLSSKRVVHMAPVPHPLLGRLQKRPREGPTSTQGL